MKNFSVWSRNRLESPFFAWSRSRPNLVGADLGRPEPDLPKKVTAPQHCL